MNGNEEPTGAPMAVSAMEPEGAGDINNTAPVEGGNGQPNTGSEPTATEEPGAAPSAAAEDPEHEVTIDGEVVRVKQSELLSGYSRHADYTRKTQALSEKEKEIESQIEARAVAEADRRWNEWLEKQDNTSVEGGEEDPNKELSDRIAAMEHEAADSKLDSVLSELKKDFPLLNEQRFLHEATAAGVKNWEDFRPFAEKHQAAMEAERTGIFDEISGNPEHPKMKALQERIIANYLKEKGGEEVTPGAGGAPKVVVDPTAVRKKTPQEIDDAALRALETPTG